MANQSFEKEILIGRVFVSTGNGHSFDAYQVIGTTAKYVKARRVKIISKHVIINKLFELNFLNISFS
jgi:hypothetical protein